MFLTQFLIDTPKWTDRRKIFTLPVIIPAEYQYMRVFIDVHKVSGGG